MKSIARHTLASCVVAAAAALGAAAPEVRAADAGTPDKAALQKAFPAKPPYSPYADRSYPTQVFFGDTHLHTAFSMDAGAFGARLTPRDAYRFARGEQINSNTGQPVKLSRPLDFLVVADHSDGMGFFPLLMSGDPELLAQPQGRRWYDQIRGGQGAEAALDIIRSFGRGEMPKGFPQPGTPAYRNAWVETIKAAEAYNEPGRFTAFIGYEWTSNTGGNNLHRNIIFRGNGTQAALVEPFTTLPPAGSDNPEQLWSWMAMAQAKTGSELLAIAHNGNLSNGLMFPTVEAFGKKLDGTYARTRAQWERLYEVTQTKGTGETHPLLSPNDEFAAFEIWDKGNLDLTVAKKPEMLPHEYARAALTNGLVLQGQLGTNPYQFGLIGSSDAHTGLAAMGEDNFFGKTVPQEPSPERLTKVFAANMANGLKIMDWETGASGYAAVWAAANTREAIFDAMKRRETYATTGSRMIVRFFGGWDFAPADAAHRLPAQVGYTKGVPMGAELSRAPNGKAPTFLVAALKDPYGANLDRIQVVKGWVDKDGKAQERIYDAAVSGGRTIGADGRARAPVGNTVDLASASWTNTIGAPELIAAWKDPDFDPRRPALYYLRVLEIPTPRWTAYDAARFGNQPLPGTTMTLQERAYTSPIWYSPS
ncbi:MAG: DUF3604 domain-containing protein [Burkholderiales bacterium]|nr:DUF3604 domain-containing protein [Burkholderiales bacterium]